MKIKNLFSILIIFSSVFFLNCKESVKSEIYDSHYFKGLEFLKNGQILEAKKSFKICFQKGSYFCARKSGENLTKLGGIQEREEFCQEFYEKFKDEDAELFLLREEFDNKEYSKIISQTKKINYSESLNEAIFIRLSSFAQKNYKNLENEIELWFSSRLVSVWHYKFYENYLQNEIRFRDKNIGSQENENFEFTKNLSQSLLNLIDFRIHVYKSSFKIAFSKIPLIEKKYLKYESVISHIGRASLYGSSDFLKNAEYFKNLAQKSSSLECKFYSYFYAGRLCEKSGANPLQAMNYFEKAMENAATGNQFDNALWYYFDSALKISTERAIFAVKKYFENWENPEYFDDFFETLTPVLISEKKWQIFGDLYKNLDKKANDAAISKFAYLYARGIGEGFVKFADENDAKTEQKNAFLRALESGSEPYYKIMALNFLDEKEDLTEKTLISKKQNFNFEKNEDAEKYLLLMMKFGFSENLYEEYLSLLEKNVNISLETALKLSEYLKSCAKNDEKFYVQSLRLSSKAILNSEKDLTLQQMKMFYPKNFESLISSACKKYDLPEEYLYALVRTESFFDSGIKSSAGAVGLTQLMESTAGDVAKKLKWRDFDLTDSFQNIEMGAFYLKELINRLDGNILTAFFSYNAGISKVRRWIKNSELELGFQKSLPLDLFLETIPYEETRNYGKKLVSSSVYYAFLYSEKPIEETLSQIF